MSILTNARKSVYEERKRSFEECFFEFADEMWREGGPKRIEIVSPTGILCLIEYPGVTFEDTNAD